MDKGIKDAGKLLHNQSLCADIVDNRLFHLVFIIKIILIKIIRNYN